VLSSNEYFAVFNDLQTILTFHREHFSKELEKEVRNKRGEGKIMLGKTFLQYFQFFKLYTNYVSKYESGVAVRKKLKKKKEYMALVMVRIGWIFFFFLFPTF